MSGESLCTEREKRLSKLTSSDKIDTSCVPGVDNVKDLQGRLITLLPEDKRINSDQAQVFFISKGNNVGLGHEVSLRSTPRDSAMDSVELHSDLQQIVEDVTNEVEITTGEMEDIELQTEVVDAVEQGREAFVCAETGGLLSANYVIDGETILDIIEEVQSAPEVDIDFSEHTSQDQIDGLSGIKSETVVSEGIVHVRKYDTEEVTFHIYHSADSGTLTLEGSLEESDVEPKHSQARGSFQCVICLQTFAKESSLKLHKRLHYNPSRCTTCGKCFAQTSQLRAHEVIHSGVRPYKCSVCHKAFHYNSSLVTHKRIHSQEKPYKCPHCDKSFLQSGNLTTHLMKHVNEEQRLFHCNKCAKRFLTQDEWKAHSEGHHKVESHSGGFMCDLCGKYFRNKQYEAAHKLSHQETSLECPQCGKSVKNEKTLASHLAYVHSGEPKFMCEECGKLYTSRQSLRQHMKLHTSEYSIAKEKRREMVQGVKQEDKPEKKIQPKKLHHCEQCEKTFTEKRHLKDHMLIHAGRKDHVCSVCRRSFRQKSTLTRHMKVHTGEKKYECGECGKAFREMANVKDHQLAVHLKMRPHSCQLCGKSFSLPLTLKKHLLTHSDDKEWFCFQCGKAFKCEQHLKNHKLVHDENRETYQCDYCLGIFKRPVCLKKHLQRCAGVPPDKVE